MRYGGTGFTGVDVEAIYMGKDAIRARVGDEVSGPGDVRGTVIRVHGSFVDVLSTGTGRETADAFVLPQRLVQCLGASRCICIKKQTFDC